MRLANSSRAFGRLFEPLMVGPFLFEFLLEYFSDPQPHPLLFLSRNRDDICVGMVVQLVQQLYVRFPGRRL